MNDVTNTPPCMIDAQLSDLKDTLAQQAKPEPQPKREYTKAQQLLIPIALILGILFDRIVAVDGVLLGLLYTPVIPLNNCFWLAYLVLFYAYHWKSIRSDKLLWCIAALAALLCLWGFFHNLGAYNYSNLEYSTLNFLVIPAALMAHAQIFAHKITQRQVFLMAAAWLRGFFVTPFSAMHHFFGALISSTRLDKKLPKKAEIKRIFLAVGLSALLLIIIVPLLLDADMAFRYFFLQTFGGGFSFGETMPHVLTIAITALLFFSFFWNTQPQEQTLAKSCNGAAREKLKLESAVLCIVISAVVFVYTLFCIVQFTYLFAQAGLPDGLTYAEYARAGFGQIVVICALNLLIFGFCIFSDRESKALSALLIALLSVTGIILASGFVRLNLYIGAYGMTWLRLLSAWFILYLAAVLILCAVRLFQRKLPVVFLCGMLLLVWYTILGYANPSALVDLPIWN